MLFTEARMFGFHILFQVHLLRHEWQCVFKNYEKEIQESDSNDIPAGMNSSGKAHLDMCSEI
jgi:hypothetical protein